MTVTNPPTVSSVQSYLLASVLGANANGLATTTLSWANGMSAANTIPLYAQVFRRTGSLSLMVATLRLNAVIIQPIAALASALLGVGADPIGYSLDTTTSATVIPVAGNWDLTVGTINGSSATLDVFVYGLKIA